MPKKTSSKRTSSSTQHKAMMKSNPYSFKYFTNFIADNFSLLFLLAIIFLGGFVLGSLWTENTMLKKGVNRVAGVEDVAQDAAAVPSSDAIKNMPKVSKDDHIRGKQNAKVVIVEYSDYECPFCSRFHPTMNQIYNEYNGKVAWVYRHYPLEMLHPNANRVSQTSECVAKYIGEDAFWKLSDTIYERFPNDKEITSETGLTSLLSELGYNSNKVQSCITNEEMASLIKDHQAGASKAGVNGTPASILVTSDGEYELISGAMPYESVKQIIEKYL